MSCHNQTVTNAIGILYTTALAAWLALVIIIFIIEQSKLALAIGGLFAAPLALLWYNHEAIDLCDESEMVKSGVLSVSIIITISLLNYLTANYKGPRNTINSLVLASLIVVLVSVPDFYFGHTWIGLTRHIRIVLQIAAVGMIALTIAIFYSHSTDGFLKSSQSQMMTTNSAAIVAA